MAKPKKPRKRVVLMTMSPSAHRALAIKWARFGFAASGRGFHGESYNEKRHPALARMLDTYFANLYDEEYR